MLFNMENLTIETPKNCTRSYEFKQAVKYLLTIFPPKTTNLPLKLDISFLKKNCTERGQVGDYFGVERQGFFEVTIRVAYGRNGNNRDAIRTLFHEYKHMLQDTEGYLTQCIESEAWVHEQFPVYLEWLAKETEISLNKHRSKINIENGTEYVTFIMRDKVHTLTKDEATNVLEQLSTKLEDPEGISP